MEVKQEVDDSLFLVKNIKLEIRDHFISNEIVKDIIWTTQEGSKISDIIKNELVVIKQESSNDPQDDHLQQTRTNPNNNTDQIDAYKNSEVAQVKDSKKLWMGTSANILPGGILICNLCGNLYIRKVELFHHISRHFVKKKRCLTKYSVNQNKSNKYQLLQTDNNKLLIENIQDSSNRKSFDCSICLKSFRDKYSLQCHTRCHSGEKPFNCDICLKSFSTKSNMKSHIRCHTGERPFECEVCFKLFRKKSHLGRHKLYHTGEKPFKCEICFKSFGVRDTLNKHMLCHTGEKPHKCEICLKTFRVKGTLNRHMLCHTGENPFKCDICLKPFTQKGNLNRHMRSHANDLVVTPTIYVTTN